MPNLNQGAWVPGTDEYRFAHNSIPVIPITGAPADANFARWAMLHDGADYRLYLFRGSFSDTLYQFAWNGTSYEYGYRSIPVLTLIGSRPTSMRQASACSTAAARTTPTCGASVTPPPCTSTSGSPEQPSTVGPHRATTRACRSPDSPRTPTGRAGTCSMTARTTASTPSATAASTRCTRAHSMPARGRTRSPTDRSPSFGSPAIPQTATRSLGHAARRVGLPLLFPDRLAIPRGRGE